MSSTAGIANGGPRICWICMHVVCLISFTWFPSKALSGDVMTDEVPLLPLPNADWIPGFDAPATVRSENHLKFGNRIWSCASNFRYVYRLTSTALCHSLYDRRLVRFGLLSASRGTTNQQLNGAAILMIRLITLRISPTWPVTPLPIDRFLNIKAVQL